jgi:hypothetical protein
MRVELRLNQGKAVPESVSEPPDGGKMGGYGSETADKRRFDRSGTLYYPLSQMIVNYECELRTTNRGPS